MLGWFRRLFAAPPPPPPRVAALSARLDDVELELEQLNARLEDNVKAIHARITNKLRREAPAEDQGDGDGDGSSEGNERQPTRGVPSTAHLARRFRSF